MPVTGLPLPFMSYGGSFIISCLLMMGLLVNLKAHGHNL
jgi:rod shape determining protein RodA